MWHGVGSEILSCCMYVPVYVFGIVSTVFSFFFLLPLCFLHNIANNGSLYIEGHSDLPGFRRGLGSCDRRAQIYHRKHDYLKTDNE